MDEIDDFEDFRQEMFWGVQEGAFLFELPVGARDHTRDGIVEHGPWPPEACARCLLTWFDHGWIEVYVLSEHLNRWASVDLTRDPSDENVRIAERGRARANGRIPTRGRTIDLRVLPAPRPPIRHRRSTSGGYG